MDSLLVGQGRSHGRANCEPWLLSTLELIASKPVLGGRREQIVAMAEFAIAALVLAEADGPGRSWGNAAVARLAEWYRQRAVVESLARAPDSVVAHAWIVAALGLYGYHSPIPTALVLERLTRRALFSPAVPRTMRDMQETYLIDRLSRGVSNGPPEVEGIVADPVWPRSPLTSRYGALYDLTHAVYFLSDLGQHRWPAGRDLLGRETSRVTRELALAGERCLAESQHDLVGEIALALHWVDAEARTRPLLHALLDAQAPNGAILGWPGARGLRGTYHATLVALMALTVCQER